jgi:threonine synthase
MKGVVATTSPSMDIQISSNFERLLFEASTAMRQRCARLHGPAEAIGRIFARKPAIEARSARI